MQVVTGRDIQGRVKTMSMASQLLKQSGLRYRVQNELALIYSSVVSPNDTQSHRKGTAAALKAECYAHLRICNLWFTADPCPADSHTIYFWTRLCPAVCRYFKQDPANRGKLNCPKAYDFSVLKIHRVSTQNQAFLPLMVLALLLLPTLIAMAMLNTTNAARVLVRVYVPCLMLVPVHMTASVGGYHLTDTALVVTLLSGVGLIRWRHTLKFTFLDACILIFAFSAFYADAHQRTLNIAIYALCQNLSLCAFPYFVGRTLIEQTGARKDFIKTMVFCLAVVGVISLYEYRFESNIFNVLESKISGDPPAWGLQTRWGFARIAGPYGGSIIAAMMFTTGLMLQMWLTGTKSWESSKALRFFRTSRRAKAVTLGLCLGLFLTQSRGPWMGCAFGLAVASIGFAKNRRRAATFTLSGLAVALLLTSIFLKAYAFDQAYTHGAGGDADQQNAAYRADLIPTYMPLISQGGLWGWGTPMVISHGQAGWMADLTSIDNEYILIAMAQGYLGVGLFVLFLVGSIWRAARFCATFRNRQDIMLAYCLLGALLALTFTVTTVALMDPMLQLSFLLFGWTQSLRPTGDQQEALAPAATTPFEFKRVFA